MKILKDNEFAALSAKAANWEETLSAIKEVNAEFNAEEATAETVAQALASASIPGETLELSVESENLLLVAANESIEQLNTAISAKDVEISELQEQVSNLTKGAGEQAAVIIPGAEGEAKSEKTNDLVAFADKNAGSHNEIIEMMKADGLLK